MKTIVFFVFLITINVFVFSQNDYATSLLLQNRNISDYYFPENSFFEEDNLDLFVQNWYGNALDVLDNEILIHKNNITIIRFTCLRSFHKPFSIKVIWDNNNAKLIFSMSDGMGGYEVGKLISHFEKYLSNDQINKLLESINIIFDQPTKIEEYGLDGSQWIIEININGRYKVVDRWSPKSGVVYNIGKYLIELSGEKICELY